MSRRVGLVLYWQGCVVAAVIIARGVFLLATHDTDPDGRVARYRPTYDSPACIEWRSDMEEIRRDTAVSEIERFKRKLRRRREQPDCTEVEPKPNPYPWGGTAMRMGLAVSVWVPSRVARYVLRGD